MKFKNNRKKIIGISIVLLLVLGAIIYFSIPQNFVEGEGQTFEASKVFPTGIPIYEMTHSNVNYFTDVIIYPSIDMNSLTEFQLSLAPEVYLDYFDGSMEDFYINVEYSIYNHDIQSYELISNFQYFEPNSIAMTRHIKPYYFTNDFEIEHYQLITEVSADSSYPQRKVGVYVVDSSLIGVPEEVIDIIVDNSEDIEPDGLGGYIKNGWEYSFQFQDISCNSVDFQVVDLEDWSEYEFINVPRITLDKETYADDIQNNIAVLVEYTLLGGVYMDGLMPTEIEKIVNANFGLPPLSNECFSNEDCGEPTFLGDDCDGFDYWEYWEYNICELGSCITYEDGDLIEENSLLCGYEPECYVGEDCFEPFFDTAMIWCDGGDVFAEYHEPECFEGSCGEIVYGDLYEQCPDGCDNGECIIPECYIDDDCGLPQPFGEFCNNDDLWMTWEYPLCIGGICDFSIEDELFEQCDYGCDTMDNICNPQPEDECYMDEDCGLPYFDGTQSCNEYNLEDNYVSPTCANNGINNYCEFPSEMQVIEEYSETCGYVRECYANEDCGESYWDDMTCMANGDIFGDFHEVYCGISSYECFEGSYFHLYEQCSYGCDDMTNECFEAYLFYRYDSGENSCSPVEIILNDITENDYVTIGECGENIYSPYFRFDSEENSCSGIDLTLSEVTSNDYETIEECGENILVPTTTSSVTTGYELILEPQQAKVEMTLLNRILNWFKNLFN